MHVAVKDFTTIIHRFREGDAIPAGADLSPFTVVDLKDRGFVKAQRIDYDAMTRPELEALAAERGVDITGARSKADITAAIDHAEKAADAIVAGNYDALTKGDLERLAHERGLDTSGAKTKHDLVVLLQSHPAPAAIV